MSVPCPRRIQTRTQLPRRESVRMLPTARRADEAVYGSGWCSAEGRGAAVSFGKRRPCVVEESPAVPRRGFKREHKGRTTSYKFCDLNRWGSTGLLFQPPRLLVRLHAAAVVEAARAAFIARVVLGHSLEMQHLIAETHQCCLPPCATLQDMCVACTGTLLHSIA